MTIFKNSLERKAKMFGLSVKDLYKCGIFFWVGAGVYSLINLIMNISNIPQNKILDYDLIITGAAAVGLIINLILLKRVKS